MHFVPALIVMVFGIAISASPVDVSPQSQGLNSTSFEGDTGIDATPFPFEYNEANINTLAAALEWIESIPDAVISSGPNTISGWSKDHDFEHFSSSFLPPTEDRGSSDNGSVDLAERQLWWVIANCVATITRTVLESGIPAAKILKIKKYIEEAGGVYKAAKAMLKAGKVADLEKVSEAVWKLALELSGVGPVYGACFA